MRKILLMIIAALACGLSAMAQKTSVFAYTNQTLECLGVELDGSQTLRVSGVGRNKADSKEQAKKRGVGCYLQWHTGRTGRMQHASAGHRA